jgi:hypothetical protein
MLFSKIYIIKLETLPNDGVNGEFFDEAGAIIWQRLKHNIFSYF